MKGNIITLTGKDIILDKNNPTALVYVKGAGWIELEKSRSCFKTITIANEALDHQSYKRFHDKEDESL